MLKVLKMSKLSEKFTGCMIGAVVGDCLGAPVECQYWVGIKPSSVEQFFHNYRTKSNEEYEYTDDTAMAREVADSLIENKGIDAKDLARKFWESWNHQPWRGYGQNVVKVFEKLMENSSKNSDPFLPASEQFDGKGSYGNGAAMRVHPVGLFFSDVDEIKSAAETTSRITHSNSDGINGAILQALSTFCALNDMNSRDHIKFIQDVALEFQPGDKELTYQDQINRVVEMLDADPHDFKNGYKLGNSVSALESVPTAIYAYLRAQNHVPGLETDNPFERTIQLAMSFGGDTDTICSMAGALAGAKYGESIIPGYMISTCEGVQYAKIQGNRIFEFSSSRKVPN